MDRGRGRPARRARLTGGPTAKGERAASTRRIALAGESVDYRLVRARRRTIGMAVDLDGLTVRAPRWVTLREIEEALAERAAWIVRTLAEWRSRRRDVLPREWRTGAPILYLGAELRLAVFPSRATSVRPDLFDLTVLHPAAADERAVADTVARWLRDEAAQRVLPRVATYAHRVTATVPPVRLSNARSEWGSCNHKGEIRLNWRLIQLPPALADYVVAHEVAHLVELNHSRRFWALVESLLPGHEAHRRALEEWTALLAA
ncbi:MAG TPA: SprT family zinc-dependent metalloprotease [Casimicrobiaceae bacterium]|nr:SprT family zinc-dependent metalloprotease [Casimicrobiaceae bacterium]